TGCPIEMAEIGPSTSQQEWIAWWNEHFPDSPPVGFVLRQIYHGRWLRIHSLPASKRYADTEEEFDELLRRYNTVATQTLGEGSQCYLIQGFWMDDAEAPDGWALERYGDEGVFRFEVSKIVWHVGAYDGLLREVADDRRAHVIFASLDTKGIFA